MNRTILAVGLFADASLEAAGVRPCATQQGTVHAEIVLDDDAFKSGVNNEETPDVCHFGACRSR
jgi:hypothetical protein